MTPSETSPGPRPPGPEGNPVVGQWRFLRDPLGYLERAHRDHGDLVRLPLVGSPVAAFGPDEVDAVNEGLGEQVEIDGGGGVDLPPRHTVQGRGVLNSTGAEHALYRRICHRALGGRSLASYSTIAAQETERLLATWSPGDHLDLLPVMTGLTRRIFKRYMFGADPAVRSPAADAAVDLYIDILESTPRRLATTFLPVEVPGLAQRRKLRVALAAIDAEVEAIADGRVRPADHSLARALLDELDREEVPRDPGLVRDFMLQLHFAGLTSLASAVVWALLLLSLHPGPARTLLDELATAVEGRVPLPSDVRSLPYLEAVLDETMRLYPAAAWEVKRAVGPVEVGGQRLPAGVALMLAPWVTQRSGESFPEPLEFRPERFLGGPGGYPSAAFQPWGIGERSCIGKQLARNAFRSIVGGVAQRFRLDLEPDQRIDPDPGLLGNRVLPKPGVRVVLAAQDGVTERSAARVLGSVVGAVPGPEVGP
ncbi:cytochrome P450 [Actinosynnema sp. NPDC050436]|uniref:cytochrome P450 n=1 Tax=Actinosynnema sp. NPDC050436 TaxID=3155659 RepID=UPI0033F6A052